MTGQGRGRKLPQVLTEEQARALLALPSRRYPTGRRNRALMSLLYAPCCLRIAEALALKLRDVDLKEGTCKVWRGKGAKDRTCYIDAATTEALRAWLEVRPAGAETLLCKLDGGKVDSSYVRHLLARLGERAGTGFRVHPHLLRHSGASELLRKGFTLAEVARVLGHSNVSTTSIYLHVFDSDLAAKVRALNGEQDTCGGSQNRRTGEVQS